MTVLYILNIVIPLIAIGGSIWLAIIGATSASLALNLPEDSQNKSLYVSVGLAIISSAIALFGISLSLLQENIRNQRHQIAQSKALTYFLLDIFQTSDSCKDAILSAVSSDLNKTGALGKYHNLNLDLIQDLMKTDQELSISIKLAEKSGELTHKLNTLPLFDFNSLNVDPFINSPYLDLKGDKLAALLSISSKIRLCNRYINDHNIKNPSGRLLTTLVDLDSLIKSTLMILSEDDALFEKILSKLPLKFSELYSILLKRKF